MSRARSSAAARARRRTPRTGSAIPRARRCSTRCCSTSRGSASSTWATRPRWRSCCSSSRSWPPPGSSATRAAGCTTPRDDRDHAPRRRAGDAAPPGPPPRARRDRRPQPADRARDRVPVAVRVHGPHRADDQRPGALLTPLAAAVPLAQRHRRVREGADVALHAQHDALRGAQHDRRAGLEHPRRLRAVADSLEGPRRGLPARAGDDDAARAGNGGAAVRDVVQARAGRHAGAADRPQLVRRRVLDLPAAPVLPHDPRGVRGRRPRRRLRRDPDHADGDPATGQAGDRRRRAVQLPLRLERLLRPAAVHGRERRPLDAVGRAGAVPDDLPGPVEPDDDGHAAVHGAGDRRLLRRPEGVRRGRHADGGEGMRVAVIGAGSTYTPELVSGLDADELTLHDIDPERLDIVGGLARRMRGGITLTTDLERALAGADFVLIQIRVGGKGARLEDETRPLACGCIGQETTGAGGLAKALRTVPIVLEIAARVPKDTWIVDFTNPVGIVTRALLDAGHRAIGLCNVAIGFERAVAPWLGVEPERIVVDQVGLNHLTWVRAVWLDGRDELPGLLETHGDELAAGIPRAVLDELGAVPSYYLRYYYAHDEVLAAQLNGEKPRAQEVAEIERELLELYKDPRTTAKPKLLEQRGGAFYSEAASRLVRSLHTGDGATHVVDIRNYGTLAGLGDPHRGE